MSRFGGYSFWSLERLGFTVSVVEPSDAPSRFDTDEYCMAVVRDPAIAGCCRIAKWRRSGFRLCAGHARQPEIAVYFLESQP